MYDSPLILYGVVPTGLLAFTGSFYVVSVAYVLTSYSVTYFYGGMSAQSDPVFGSYSILGNTSFVASPDPT